LGLFQAVVFGHVIAPEEELLVKLLFVCCPALWWNYLGSSSAEYTRYLVTESKVQDPCNRSEVGLICSSAEDEESECGKFRELRMAAIC
jgi:hypothetical protein